MNSAGITEVLVILAFTQRFRVAVPDELLQSGWGAGAAPALQWRRNSPVRQQWCLVQQHKGNSGSAVGTPAGTGTAAAQQN